MKDETRAWLCYARENVEAARVLFELKLYGPCLQNVQQGIEKALKALLIERLHVHRKTHSIGELCGLLGDYRDSISLRDEDCDLLDSIYLPSKYPLGGHTSQLRSRCRFVSFLCVPVRNGRQPTL